jgi:hypothetical protein
MPAVMLPYELLPRAYSYAFFLSYDFVLIFSDTGDCLFQMQLKER